jgi:putative acetyltransferase
MALGIKYLQMRLLSLKTKNGRVPRRASKTQRGNISTYDAHKPATSSSARRSRDDERVVVREQREDDYEAVRQVYAEAFLRPRFRPPQSPGSVPPEVGLFEALWEASDVVPGFSFTALTDRGAVGHVTASRATVAADAVVAVGPIGVLPEYQGLGVGSALMNALLTAADAADVPLIVLLGAPQYYKRFGFRPAKELGVLPPEPEWGDAFQARPLTAYTESVAGQFRYASAFSS